MKLINILQTKPEREKTTVRSPPDFTTTFSDFSDVGNVAGESQKHVGKCQNLSETWRKMSKIVGRMFDLSEKCWNL